MKKRICLKLKYLLFSVSCVSFMFMLLPKAMSQDENPVIWRFSARKLNERTFEVRLKAIIRQSWHIYAQQIPEGTALPTRITFDKNPLLSLQGNITEEGQLEEKTEEGQLLKYYSDRVEFVQVVRLKAAVKTSLVGRVNFMACTNEKCLPPSDREFSITIDGRN